MIVKFANGFRFVKYKYGKRGLLFLRYSPHLWQLLLFLLFVNPIIIAGMKLVHKNA